MATENPTAEQLQQGQEVAAAGVAAAQAEPEAAKRKPAARRAIKQEAAARGWELSDDDAGRIADMVVDRIRDAGGFDKPMEPVQPPPAAPVPAQAQLATAPEPPARRSFAERFRSGS